MLKYINFNKLIKSAMKDSTLDKIKSTKLV